MEQKRLCKLLEEKFTEFSDKISGLQGRLEDLLFRAQRLANALKRNQGAQDILFKDDLELLRRATRTFVNDATILPEMVEWLDREAHFDPDDVAPIRTLLAQASQVQKDMAGLCEQCRMLHQFIPEAELRIQAWYMVQDLEGIGHKFQMFPNTISTRILNKVSTPPPGASPPLGQAAG